MTPVEKQRSVHMESFYVKLRMSGAEPSGVKQFVEQDAYTLHRPVRKRFPRTPCTVSNLLDVWEADLVDVQSLAKHNDGHRYLLTVIDVFTKYLHIVPLKSKTAKAVSEAFETVLKMTSIYKPSNDASSGFEPTRVRNSRVRLFKSYWSRKAFNFRCEETPI